MEIKKLWLVNDNHYNAWKQDKNTPSQYVVKQIIHSRGDNTIDGPVLDVPEIATGLALQNIAWKSDAARRDEIILLSAEFTGCKDGEKAFVEIFEYDHDGNHDFMEKIEASVTDGKLDAEWKFVYQEDTDDILTEEDAKKTGGKYNPPEYYFTVTIGEKTWGDKQESSLLLFKDWLEVELQDEDGKPLADEPFTCFLADGTKQEGVLDANGYAKLESVSPGPVEVSFSNFPMITIKK
jgi:hypothetical protein